MAAALLLGGLGALIAPEVASASNPAPPPTSPAVTYTTVPGAISFPTTAIGSSSTVPVTIIADTSPAGPTVLNVPTATGVSPAAGFYTLGLSSTPAAFSSAGLCDGFTFNNSGDSCVDDVTFTPTTVGVQTDVATFTDSAGDSFNVTITADATGPELSASPDPVSFGTVILGNSANETVVVTNNGTAEADFTTPSSVAADPAFTITSDGCGSGGGVVVQPGNTCSVTLNYKPTSAPATENATLTITPNNAPVISVPLTGSAANVPPPPDGPTTLTPTSLGFGDVTAFTTAGPEFFTLTNTNATELSPVSSISLSGDTSSFTRSGGTCPAAPFGIAASGSCTIGVDYTPSTTAITSATVTVTFSDGQPTLTALASGEGVTPTLTITAGPIHFGDVDVNAQSPVTQVVVTNTGLSAVTLGAVAASPGFVEDGGCTGILEPGATCNIGVAFAPVAAGPITGDVSVAVTTPGLSPLNVALDGTGVAPYITVTPDFDFGSVALATSSASQVFTVKDVSGDNVTVGASSRAGFNAGDFHIITDGCSAVELQPGQSCDVSVEFEPTVTGPEAAELVVPASDTSFPATSIPSVIDPLTGTGDPATTATVSPNPLAFGAVAIGQVSPQLQESVQNTGTTPLLVTGVVILGPEASDFTDAAPGCPFGSPIAPGATCTIDVFFTPTAANGVGPITATLGIIDNAAGHPQNVLLTGTADPQPVDALTASPALLNFNSVGVGVTSAAQQVTVTNPSTSQAIKIGTASQAGPNAADFGSTSLPNSDTCSGITLNPGASCVFTETLTPSLIGPESAELLVPYGAPGGTGPTETLTIPLFGGGVATTTETVLPNPLVFPATQVGTTSTLETFTVTNTGTNPLIESAAAPVLAGLDPTDFTAAGDTCTGVTVAPGGTCTFAFDFTPAAVSTVNGLSASVSFVDNGIGSPHLVTLEGTGVNNGGALTAAPSNIAFGNVGVGLTAAAQTVTVTNGSTAPVTITAVTNDGTDAAQFGDGTGPTTDDCTGDTLNPGATCTFSEAFSPTSLGILSAAAEIKYGAATLSVPLSGTGVVDTTVTVSPNPLVFSTPVQESSSSAIQVETVTNNGPNPLTVASVGAITGTDGPDFDIVGNSCSGSIPSGDSCQIYVVFAPTGARPAGPETAAFTVTDNAAGSPQSVTLQATSIAQPAGGAVTVTPDPDSFGSQGIGTTTTNQVTVTNGTTSTISFPAVPSDAGSGEFSIQANGCTGALNAGNSCTITETFTPTGLGTASATLSVPYSGGTATDLLTGTGVPTSTVTTNNPIAFGSQAAGTTSAAQPAILTNTGTNPITVSTVSALMGANPGDFAIESDACAGATVDPGASCDVYVAFSPLAGTSGPESAEFTVTDTGTGSPQTFNLSGNATPGSGTGLTISPAVEAFGTAGIGQESTDEALTVTNGSATNVTLATVVVNGSQSSAFVIDSDECSTKTLVPNATCTVEVHFAPGIVGNESAVLVVPEINNGPSVSSILTGTGVADTTDSIDPSPTVDFGNIVQGGTSQDHIITITNTGTVNPLIFTGPILLHGDTTDFTIISENCTHGSGEVYPGQTCEVVVDFTPHKPVPPEPDENDSATISFQDNATGTTQLVNLNGQGTFTAVEYSVAPTFVNFGTQSINTTSPPAILTVTNTATGGNENDVAALEFPAGGDVVLSGTNANEFEIQNDLCSGRGVDPPGTDTGDTCTVDVVFAPVAPTGPAYAFITFFPTNGSGIPQQVELIGDGVPQGSLSLGAAANGLNFGNVIINTTSPSKQVVITNTSSTSTLIITGISIIGVDAADYAVLPIPGDCGTSYPIIVQIGYSCTVTIDFTPSALGVRTAALNIVDNTPESPDVVALTGVGVPYAPEQGYWLAGSDGGVFAFGAAPFYGSLGNLRLNSPIVGMAATKDGKGYWLVAADGGIFTFGDAQYYGSTGGLRLNKPIVGMARTPTGNGYWLVASDGGIFSFGDAQFYGSTGSLKLNKPIVAITKTPTGKGYILVASDGGVFCFGDAQFHGSAANYNLNKPINGLVESPDGGGYLMSASDGGLFAFGDAVFMGSTASLNLKEPIVGMDSTPDFGGYWQVGNDGGVFAYGDAQFHGSIGDTVIIAPDIVGLATDPVYGFPG